MPWCDACARYFAPSGLSADGACPECGRVLASARELRAEEAESSAEPKAPWHFKVLVGSAALYLGWRFVQGVIWVLGRR